MQYTAKELARIVKGTVEGDENTRVWKPCKIEEGEEGGITFLGNPKYTHYIYEKESSIVIVKKDFVPEHPVNSTANLPRDARGRAVWVVGRKLARTATWAPTPLWDATAALATM